MQPTNRLVKSGAIFFVLWGVLHIAVGLGGAMIYLTRGPIGLIAVFGGSAAPAEAHALVRLAAHIALDFLLVLTGYGLLAIWGAVLIWQGRWLGFWLNTILLGIADAAFMVALMIPGETPISEGIWGPIFYVLGVTFTAAGMCRRHAAGAASRP